MFTLTTAGVILRFIKALTLFTKLGLNMAEQPRVTLAFCLSGHPSKH